MEGIIEVPDNNMRREVQEEEDTKKNGARKDMIETYQKALDDMVSVNGLFTAAVFLGLTFSKNLGLEKNPKCKLSDYNTVARRLLVNEIISFSFYLLSSLVAKALSSYLSIYNLDRRINVATGFQKTIRVVMLGLTMVGTFFGCIFLTVSMVDVIRMRLGKITCGYEARTASATMIAIVSLALLIYIPFSIKSLLFAVKKFEGRAKSITNSKPTN